MSKCPSSIFSFSTLQIRTIPRSWWYSLSLACSLLLCLEGAARLLVAPVGEFWGYWDPKAISKFAWYHQETQRGQIPPVVVIGDSTGARDFDPRAFRTASGGTAAYNLAWPANFPLALRASTFPLLRQGAAPQYVLLFQAPGAYIDNPRIIRFEQSILSSPIGQKNSGKTLVADYVALARLYKARWLLKRYWLDRKDIIAPPLAEGFMPLTLAQHHENLGPGPETSTETEKTIAFSPRRRDTVRELALMSSQRGFHLIVVIPPQRLASLSAKTVEHKRWLERQAPTWGFTLWDYSDSSFLSSHHFWDNGHLNASGAQIFSAKIGEKFREYSDLAHKPSRPVHTKLAQ